MNPQFAKELARIKKIISPLCAAHSKHTRPAMPLPVWDSTGTMIGVSVSTPLLMGASPCEAQATFAIKTGTPDEEIAAKANAAIAALSNELVVTIKPVRKQEKAG